MNDSTNTQGNSATGGNTATGNPQDIGSQSIFTPNQSLQSSTSSLLGANGSTLTLTDPNGQPVELTAPARASVTAAPKPTNHKAPLIIGLAGVVIIVIVAITWFMTKSSKSYS